MKLKSFKIGTTIIFLIFVASLLPAEAHQTTGRHHKTQNGLGCLVEHSHPPRCPSNGKCVNGYPCPSDAVCEITNDFSPSHRTYSWTNQWNCHGRTFDNRGSWTGSAAQFITCDYGYSPFTPQDGDAIMWDYGREHSATIIGPWNGLSTIISSKYGCCGEYRHALSNALRVYKSNWAVIRLTSGTPVFKQMEVGDRELPSDPEGIDAIRKQMPWYTTVMASEIVHAIEKPRLIRKTGELDEENRKQLIAMDDPFAQIEILLKDLESEHHFAAMAAYNHPELSLDFIAGIEAGQILVRLAHNFPEELRDTVVSLLEEKALSESVPDGTRGASIFFLSQILSSEEKGTLAETLRQSFSTDKSLEFEGQVDVVDYFLRTFLE